MMNKSNFHLIPFIILLWILYNSNSGGAGSSNFNCNNCHGGSNTTTMIDSIVLRDVNTLDKMVKYSPNKPYIITIYGSNSGSLNRFGFQMNHGGKGNFSNPTADCQTSVNIWEHIRKISGNAGKFQVSARWNSPAAGSGNVTLEAYLNAVDNDNTNQGDRPSSKFTYSFDELTSTDSAAVQIKVLGTYDEKDPKATITFKAYPTNGGNAPEYQWKVNNKNIGSKTTEDQYSSSTIRGGDTVSCLMYSNKIGAFPNPAKSNELLVFKTNSSSIGVTNDKTRPNMFIKDKILHINNLNGAFNSSVYSLSGRLVYSCQHQYPTTIDLSSLSEGIYIFKMGVNGHIHTQKIHLK